MDPMARLPKTLRRQADNNALAHMSTPPLQDDTEYELIDVRTGEAIVGMRLSPEMVTIISVWSGGMPVMEHDALDYEKTFPGLNVPTKDGAKRASQGDYVIKLADGSFDVRKEHEVRPVREV